MNNPRLSSGDKDTQSTFSFIKRVRNLLIDYNNCLFIFLWDGKSWRKDIYKAYKENRESTTKQVEDRKSYYEQSDDIKEALRLLGLRQMWALNMEADDMAAILSKKFSEAGHNVTLITADGDWKQLINERVNWVDIIHHKTCSDYDFEAVTGFKSTDDFIEYKCVAGDKSDNIIGLNGIGEKTVINVQKSFGSFRCFLEIDPSIAARVYKENIGKTLPKVLREIDYENASNVLEHNWRLVDLNTPDRPSPSKVIDEKGLLDVRKFEEFCYKLSFLSLAEKLNNFILPFEENIYVSK